MTTKTKEVRHRTTMVPVITMEEMPTLTAEERADFIASLEKAEAQIEAGDFIKHDPESFRAWLFSTYRGRSDEA